MNCTNMTIKNVLGVWYALDRRTLYMARDKDINVAIAKCLRNVYAVRKAVRAVDDLAEITAIFSGIKRVRAFCGRMTAGGKFYGIVKNV